MTFREKLLEEAHEEISRLSKFVAEYMNKIPDLKRFIDLMPDLSNLEDAKIFLGSYLWPVYVKIPLVDKLQVSEMIDLFQNAGWKMPQGPQVYSGSVDIRFEPDKDLKFDYSWAVLMSLYKTDETLCKLEKIGEKEEVTTVNVYEIVCPEGATEDVFNDNPA